MKQVGFFLGILAVMLFIQQCGTPSVNLQEVDQLLTEIASYEYGDSQEPLVRLQEIMQLANDKPEITKEMEARILKTLQGEATLAGKQFLCKKIVIIGSEASVPVLATLLQNPETIDMARYALEVLPGAQVDAALLDALNTTSGDYKCGIINSIGNRGDTQSVPALIALLSDEDNQVVIAALTALGDIASPEAEAALQNYIMKNKNQAAMERALDAYLKCADRYAADNNMEKAIKIYKELVQSKAAQPFRIAALRGWLAISGEEGIALMNTLLKGNDDSIKLAAIGLIPELPKSEKVTLLTDSFNNLGVDQKASFLSVVKERGDPYFLPLVTEATQNTAQKVRIAALDALATLGDDTSVMLLAQTAAEKKDPEQKTARQSLYLLNTPKVDQIIVDQISSVEDPVKIELVYAVGERGIGDAANIIVGLAEGDNVKLRMAAYRALALIATGDQMAQLVSYMSKAESKAERTEIERALVTISESMTADESKSKAILQALPAETNNEVKSSLFMVLGRIGEESALPVLRSALQDVDMELRAAAIRALSEWPNAEPADDLFQVAQKTDQPSHKVLALRGYIDLLGKMEEDESGEKITALYRRALDLKPEIPEIRKALSGLSRVGGLDALQLAAKYLDNEEVKEEAASAIARLSWSTARENPEETKPYLEKVLQITTNERTKEWAGNLLERINNADR